jgi:hypothetical protein
MKLDDYGQYQIERIGTTDTVNVKPCPICGGKPKLESYRSQARNQYDKTDNRKAYIEVSCICPICEVKHFIVSANGYSFEPDMNYWDATTKAVELWNARR